MKNFNPANPLPIVPGRAVLDSVNISFLVLLGLTGVAQPVPGFHVPQGATVRVRGHNGTPTGNAQNVSLAEYREQTQGDLLTPNTEIVWACTNTNQIWVRGTAGDGVTVSIRSA
jgi:hypothetical protein